MKLTRKRDTFFTHFVLCHYSIESAFYNIIYNNNTILDERKTHFMCLMGIFRCTVNKNSCILIGLNVGRARRTIGGLNNAGKKRNSVGEVRKLIGYENT